MSGVINKVKDALHSNKDHSTTTTHSTTHTTGTTGTTGHHGTAEGVAGPHSSRAANAADPRIDSDLDNSRTAGTANTAHTTGGYVGAGTGVIGSSGHTTGTHAQPVHNSGVANKLDPRVTTGTTGTTHTTGTTGAGTGTHVGNHSGSHHTGTTGGLSHSTNAGPHDSNMANKADPRVDSDLDGRGNRHGANTGGVFGTSGSHATPGSGTAQNTAGPHNSDMANKLDPRVDADLDGSKTVGGNKTYQ